MPKRSEVPELRDERAPEYAHVLSREVHYEGRILSVAVEDIHLPSGDVRREYIEHDDAVAVLALREGDAGEEMLLIRQYRHPVRHVLWEIPAGLLDIAGEGAAAAARRELREEADLIAGELTELVHLYATPGCSTELYTIYLARDCVPAPEPFDRGEEEADIEVRWVPVDCVLDAVRCGDLRSPTLVAAVLAYAALAR